MNNNITPSKYAKKAFVIFGAIFFTFIMGSLVIDVINYDKIIENSCPFFSAFILGIILIPALCTLTYNAFLGAKRTLKNPTLNSGSYYLKTIPFSLLSIVISAGIGISSTFIEEWFFKHFTITTPPITPCSGAFIFFGGWLIFPFCFIFLCVISIIELYIIKIKILRGLNNK